MSVTKKAGAAMSIAALAALGLALSPPAPADPGYCEGGGGWGGFGSRCDSMPAPDGSYEQCDRVNVLGFGGTNCYRVYPPN